MVVQGDELGDEIEELLDAHTTSGGMLAVTSHHAVNLQNTTVQRIDLSA
jgi:ABC-type transport system involved in cytochrome c biogenesis ATPase subunit